MISSELEDDFEEVNPHDTPLESNITENHDSSMKKKGNNGPFYDKNNIQTKSEAQLKNLTFQGVPNSFVKRNSDILNKTFNVDNNRDINGHTNLSNEHYFRTENRKNSKGHQNIFNNKANPTPRKSNSLANLELNLDTNLNMGDSPSRFLKNKSDKRNSVWTPTDIVSKKWQNALKKISATGNSNSTTKINGNTNKPSTSQPTPLNREDLENRTKSLATDIIGSLLAGGPASLFAGTQFLRDEHNHKRAPILLAMVDVKVKRIRDVNLYLNANLEGTKVDENEIYMNSNESRSNMSSNNFNTIRNALPKRMSSITPNFQSRRNITNDLKIFDKKSVFEIQLEYGLDDYRNKWTIVKSYGAMMELHRNLLRFVFQEYSIPELLSHKHGYRILLPSFPKPLSSIKSSNNEKFETSFESPRPSLDDIGSAMSLESLDPKLRFNAMDVHMKHLEDLIKIYDDHDLPIELRLERYFRLLNLALCLRPQANRLIAFYEFSTLSNLLSYENGYKGKEGLLVTGTTAKMQGWRVGYFKPHEVRDMVERHTPKWVLVRDSYITYVSDLRSATPLEVFLVDSEFQISHSGDMNNGLFSMLKNNEDEIRDIEWNLENTKKVSTKIFIKLANSERKLTFICKSEFSMKLWFNSFSKMIKKSVWYGPKRFESFAPVRYNAFAKYLVDGRDYFWSLSNALLQAEDVIYIHDWWLSPELYMRRPLHPNQKYRLDRILQEKAQEGVKIFIVVYRNVGTTVGTDSSWTKHSLLELHPNIRIIRSPNQWTQTTFFWAHHEKFVVIDNMIAFMGGIDLCYGRYDTPEHALRDDYTELANQTFPGKDYSNARIGDFYELEKPYVSMYDRSSVPRMPWHDVHMMTVGEPARDLARHFVQRWNYLIRQKRPSRPTPLLLPPSDFTKEELENSPLFRSLKAQSTCEIQILRSAGNWSLGLKNTEHSIQNAYLKLIEESEHYIYLENQFFVTSSKFLDIEIQNKIGDAIVDRIIRAHIEKKPWKAIIIIPLMPGFDSPVDHAAASSLRVIIQCQYQSISRGPTSIFARLKKLNIEPAKYIQFFSLRKWSTIGPYDKLVTEQLYVHAKIMIVDDRSCIIGSANINERSQLGNRDSEVAAIIRDTDTIKTKLNGQDYQASRFAYELRQRLMREHLGCDVDLVEIIERKFHRLAKYAKQNYATLSTLKGENSRSALIASAKIELAYRAVFGCKCSPAWEARYKASDNENHIENFGISEEAGFKSESDLNDMDDFVKLFNTPESLTSGQKQLPNQKPFKNIKIHSFNYRAGSENFGLRSRKDKISFDPRIKGNKEHKNDILGNGEDKLNQLTDKDFKSVTEQLREWSYKTLMFYRQFNKEEPTKDQKLHKSFLPFGEDIASYIGDDNIPFDKKWDMLKRINYLQYLQNKIDERLYHRPKYNITEERTEYSLENDVSLELEERGLDEDVIDLFIEKIDPTLKNSKISKEDISTLNSLNIDYVDPYAMEDLLADDFFEYTWYRIAKRNTALFRVVFHCQPDDEVLTWNSYKVFNNLAEEFLKKQDDSIQEENYIAGNKRKKSNIRKDRVSDSTPNEEMSVDTKVSSENANNILISQTGNLESGEIAHHPSYQRNNREIGANTIVFDRVTAKKILQRIHGHLVFFATDWLADEVNSNNWFYTTDRMTPIEIYN